MKKLIQHKYFPQLVLIGFVFLLYGNTINHHYNFDDEYVVLNSQVQKGFSAIPEIFTSRYHQSEDQSYGYRPIAKSTFAIEYSIFGLNPKVSHLINIILYGILILVCFQFLRAFFLQNQTYLALFICILFISHPTHTEVVASLKNREELLSFLFGLFAINFFYKWYISKKNGLLIISIFFFFISILSKENGIIWIGLLPFIYSFEESLSFETDKLESNNNSISSFFELYLIIGGLLIVYLLPLEGFINHIPKAVLVITSQYFAIKTLTKLKKNSIVQWHLIEGVIVSIFVLLFIPALILRFHYLLMYSILIFKISIILLTYLKPHIWFGIKFLWKRRKPIWFGLVIFSIAVLIVLTRIILVDNFDEQLILPKQHNPLFNERFSINNLIVGGKTIWFYSKGLVFYPNPSFYYGFNMIDFTKFSPSGISGLFILITFIFLAILTFRSRPIISFSFSVVSFSLIFFSNFIIEIPGIIGDRFMFIPSFGFCILLGLILFKVKSLSSKLSNPVFWVFSVSIISFYSFSTIDRNNDWKNKATLYGTDINHLENSARANLIYGDFLFSEAEKGIKTYGLTNTTKNQMQAAAFYYERSLKVDPNNFTVKNNLGTIYYSFLNKKKRGKSLLIESLKEEYANYYAYNNMGTIYANEEKLDSAIFYFKKGQKLKPDNVVGIESLGLAYYEKDNLDSAFKYFEKTLQKDPQKDNIHVKMGDLLIRVNQPNDALTFYNYALKINPNNTDALLKRENLIKNEN